MKKNKGIILAGGSGSRLYPLTSTISKQLLPIYDKPMIYYSLCTLMLANLRDILIISTPKDIGKYKELFKDSSKWGIRINYKVQKKPEGIAQAFILAENFLNNSPCTLILGDNIFYGNNLQDLLNSTKKKRNGATIFAYQVSDPERYGVVEFDKKKRVIKIEEKPTKPKTNYAITGLYFYDNNVVNYAKGLSPSKRGELEITDLNKIYLKKKKLHVKVMNRGYAWLDTGTFDSLLEAGQFIKTIQKRQNIKIAVPEEIAFKKKWIDKKSLSILIKKIQNKEYKNYLENILSESE
jgi:glucose-1-phosphate thymidylyltransferase